MQAVRVQKVGPRVVLRTLLVGSQGDGERTMKRIIMKVEVLADDLQAANDVRDRVGFAISEYYEEASIKILSTRPEPKGTLS